jgi:hypothetical protein
MTSTTTGLCVFACVFGAAASAMVVRNALPKHHLNDETKDLVKLAMGLVATMAALGLGMSASIFLILELDQPFNGFIQISKQPMLNALSQLGR